MLVDTLPSKFGQGLDYVVENIFKREGIFRGLNDTLDGEPIGERKKLLTEIVGRTFRSLTTEDLDDYAVLHILSPKDFDQEYGRHSTFDYGKEIKSEDVGAFQQGYRAMLKTTTPLNWGVLFAAHELGSVIIPHETSVNESEVPVRLCATPRTNSTFLLEVAQHYLQLAQAVKWCVEKKIGVKPDHHFTVRGITPMHHAAINEAARLLKNRTTPLREYGAYFSGAKQIEYTASIPDLSGLEPRWRDAEESSEIAGGEFTFRVIDYI